MKQNNHLILTWRIGRMAGHMLYGVAMVAFVFPWLAHSTRTRVERRWNKSLLGILNINVRLNGAAPGLAVQNMMVVSNHVSWLDIYLLNSVRPVRFVSKMEVRSWPLIGWLAGKTGTLFIDRTKRHDTARVNNEVAEVLNQGGCVAVFPEGTTSNGSMLRPFHASLLQPAVHSSSHIWPAAIRYTHFDGTLNMAAAYVDELTFGESLFIILRHPVIYVELAFMPPIPAQGKARRDLAKEAEVAIAAALGLNRESAETQVIV